MHLRDLAATVALFLVSAVVSRAEEQPALFSGPQVGEKLPPLPVTLGFAEDPTKVVDLVELAGGRPTLLVFVNGTNAPASLLARTLMNFAEMRGDKLAAGVINLGRHRTVFEQFLMQGSNGWWAATPAGGPTEFAEGSGKYGLNRNVTLTVLVARKGIVTANFPIIQPDRVDAQKILKDVVPLAGGNVPSVAEVAFLSIPAQLSTADIELRELICAALAANNETTARSAASAIEEYIRDNKARQAELGSALSIFLSRSGLKGLNELAVIEQLRNWRGEYAPKRQKKR